MKREPVQSTAIVSVGYDKETCILEVELSTGRVYEYYAVPLKVYKEFMTPPGGSMGRYYNAWIRNGYPYKEITE